MCANMEIVPMVQIISLDACSSVRECAKRRPRAICLLRCCYRPAVAALGVCTHFSVSFYDVSSSAASLEPMVL